MADRCRGELMFALQQAYRALFGHCTLRDRVGLLTAMLDADTVDRDLVDAVRRFNLAVDSDSRAAGEQLIADILTLTAIPDAARTERGLDDCIEGWRQERGWRFDWERRADVN